MDKIKNIIFDWDNTLFPFKEKYWESAHRKLFAEQLNFNDVYELDLFMDKYHDFDEFLWPRVHRREMTIDELRNERLRLTLRYFDIAFEENYIQGFFEQFLKTLLDDIQPNQWLINQLERLSDSYRIAILSNGGHWEQREKLRRSDIEGRYPIYISGETGFLKPDARAFMNLLNQEHFKAVETLMVGDLIEHDIEPAKKLGMKTAYIGAQKETIADFEFETIQDFFNFFVKE
ncbi:MAG: HAD family hydrolase [Streptococcaceae bacterium]|nr:HAD family hydrolase [Streptococcaceae bacterium]